MSKMWVVFYLALFILINSIEISAEQPPMNQKKEISAYYIAGVRVTQDKKVVTESRIILAPDQLRLVKENDAVEIKVQVSAISDREKEVIGQILYREKKENRWERISIPSFQIPISRIKKFKTRYPEIFADIESTPFSLSQKIQYRKREYLFEMSLGIISAKQLRRLTEIGSEGDSGIQF